MCEICHQCPCDPRCPNALPPTPVFICSGCGGDILDGDWYYDVMGEQFCQDCMERMRYLAEIQTDE